MSSFYWVSRRLTWGERRWRRKKRG